MKELTGVFMKSVNLLMESLITDVLMKIVFNIKTITHCVTRLRLYLNDRNKAEDEKIKNLPGVLGVVYGNQQYQIILGEHLFPVFDNLEKNYSVQTEAPINENLDENLVSGNEKKNLKKQLHLCLSH